jgi:hypothetical protein
VICSPGLGAVLSAVLVAVKFAVGFGVTLTGGVFIVTGGLVPSSHGVGVVITATLVILPVALRLKVPRISIVALAAAATSGKVALPGQAAHVAPLLVLYCGFSSNGESVSRTVGVFAAEGPALLTVIV